MGMCRWWRAAGSTGMPATRPTWRCSTSTSSIMRPSLRPLPTTSLPPCESRHTAAQARAAQVQAHRHLALASYPTHTAVGSPVGSRLGGLGDLQTWCVATSYSYARLGRFNRREIKEMSDADMSHKGHQMREKGRVAMVQVRNESNQRLMAAVAAGRCVARLLALGGGAR